MNKLMGNTSMPTYVKIVAVAILALTYFAALGVGVDVYVAQGPQAQLPTVVAFILGTGLTSSLSVLNLHQGASLLESASPSQAAAQSAPPSDTPTPGA